MGWRGGVGGVSKFLTSCLEQEKPPKVARRDPYHTTRPRRCLASNGQHGHPSHSLSSDTGSVKSPPENHTCSHWAVETLCID